MPQFSYRAIDRNGRTVNGTIEAPERKQVARRLGARGIRPLSIREERGEVVTATEEDDTKATALAVARREQKRREERAEAIAQSKEAGDGGKGKKKFNKSNLSLSFLKKLLTLLSSGLPLGDSVRLLSVRLADPRLREMATFIYRRLSEGRTLASAMRELPEAFSEGTVHLVEAGEASGNLVPVLERIVAYLEESAELRKKLLSSLAYPAFIVTIAFGVVVFFLLFLLPKIKTMLATLGGEMTLFAKILIVGSEAAMKAGPFLALALVLTWIGIVNWRKTARGRQVTDVAMLRIPYIGNIILYSNIFQMSNLLGTLLASGVNTTEALRLVERAIPNTLLKAKFAQCRKQIQEGVSMATALKRGEFLPDLAMDILTVGENTGNLVHSLRDIQKIYRDELSRGLATLTTVVSSVALLFAFALVTLIALAIILSVFSISNSLAA